MPLGQQQLRDALPALREAPRAGQGTQGPLSPPVLACQALDKGSPGRDFSPFQAPAPLPTPSQLPHIQSKAPEPQGEALPLGLGLLPLGISAG